MVLVHFVPIDSINAWIRKGLVSCTPCENSRRQLALPAKVYKTTVSEIRLCYGLPA